MCQKRDFVVQVSDHRGWRQHVVRAFDEAEAEEKVRNDTNGRIDMVRESSNDDLGSCDRIY